MAKAQIPVLAIRLRSEQSNFGRVSKRALPKPTVGKKMAFGILPHGTLRLLNAALKAWELRNGLSPAPSAWERNPDAA